MAVRMETCPFECGWDSGEVTTEEEGRAALRAHLTVEHEARPERNERAWADEMADMQAELEITPEELRQLKREGPHRLDLPGPVTEEVGRVLEGAGRGRAGLPEEFTHRELAQASQRFSPRRFKVR